MEVHLLQNQEAQLNELAIKTGRETDELVQEAVAKLLAHNEWFKQQVQIGIDQIERGEFIEEEEMDARVERLEAHFAGRPPPLTIWRGFATTCESITLRWVPRSSENSTTRHAR